MLLKTKLRKLSEDFQLWDATISTTCPGFKIDEILYHHDAWLLRQPNEMGTNASGQEKAVSEIPNSPVAGGQGKYRPSVLYNQCFKDIYFVVTLQ